jgi:hypothetical protein
MKRFITFLIISLLLENVRIGFAQDDKVTYVPPSPNASSLLEYASIPVNLYSGIPEISVPLYVLKGRKLNVPISLSYHASGIKVQDISSSVGLGWSLNAGGVITRIVRGVPDEEATNGYLARDFNSTISNSSIFGSISNGIIDSEPDIFFFNFNGKTGRFVLDQNKNPVQMPEQNFQIVVPDFSSGDPTWEITDLDGIRYVFGKTSNAREQTSSTLNYPVNLKTYTSSWYLSEIVLPFKNETITFSYELGGNVYFENYRQYAESYVDGVINCSPPFGWGYISHDVYDIITQVTINSPKYISSINSLLGSAHFAYINDRQDLPGALRLQELLIKNYTSQEIKRYNFDNNSYFTTDNCSLPECKRLKISKVAETTNGTNLPVKSFDYNTVNLPSRKSIQYDHWGYYNNNQTSNAIPPSKSYYTSATISFPGADKSPHEDRSQANILTEISNAAGGRQKMYYQLNAYDNNGTILTGGLRVYKITENDGTNLNGVIEKNFKYKKVSDLTDPTKSSGSIYRNHYYDFYFKSTYVCSDGGHSTYSMIKRYSTSLVDFFDIGGVHVGYSDVQIEYSNGSKEHLFFNNFINHPDDPSTFVEESETSPDFTDPDGPPFVSRGDRSYERGLLKEHIFFNSLGKKLKRIENIYDYYLASSLEVPGGRIMLLYRIGTSTTSSNTYRIGKYKYPHRGVRLLETITETYDQDDETKFVSNRNTYSYNSLHSTLVKSQISFLSDGSELQSEFKYPKDYSNTSTSPLYADAESDGIIELGMKYVIATPIETVLSLKKPGGTYKVIGGTLRTFRSGPKEFPPTAVISSPYRDYQLKVASPITDLAYSFMEDAGISGKVFRKDPRYYEVHSYDSYDQVTGNLTQETSQGLATSYTWDYNNSLVKTVTTSPQSFPQTSSFVHVPLIGLTSIKDPSQRDTYYEFDVLNRLKVIKDHNMNITSRYRYNYKNSSEFGTDFSIGGMQKTNNSITFSSSTDSELAGVSTYIWDFGDGQVLENGAKSVSHSYPNAGTYNVKLSKVNPEYGSQQASKQLIIYGIPSVTLPGSLSKDLCATTAYPKISASLIGGCPGVLNYSWTYKTSVNGSSISMGNTSSPYITFDVASSVGTYYVTCTVTDSCGQTATSSTCEVSLYKSTNCTQIY